MDEWSLPLLGIAALMACVILSAIMSTERDDAEREMDEKDEWRRR